MDILPGEWWRRLRRHWQLGLVIIAAAGFFCLASVFNYETQDAQYVKWLSPDETANYTIARHYAQTGSLQFFEKYNLIANDLIHPRSFRSDWGWIKPVSFLGLPLYYGAIARIAGIDVLPYLTPLFGAIGIIFFYLLVREFFGKTNALMSALLAAAFPVYIYFSARSMFHNILFIVCLIIGLYFSVRMVKRQPAEIGSYFRRHWPNILFALLAGLGIGAAVAARTSELLWLGPLLAGLYVFNFRRIGLVKLFFLAYGVFIALLPVMFWNETLFGSWKSSGYPDLNNSLWSLEQSGGALAETAVKGAWYDFAPLIEKIKTTVFHFGFHPGQSLSIFNDYVTEMFPWLFWLAGAGIVLFILFFKNYTRARWLYFLSWVALSAVLIIYYGSWRFFDNPDQTSTIGNSYTRYWLPFYLGALPFVSCVISFVTSIFRQRHVIAAARLIIVVVLMTVSIQFIWNEPAEGIQISIDKQRQSRNEWGEVLKRTEANAVIITRYHDKLMFPERKVIIGLFDDKNMINTYARLARYMPVYYYNFNYQDKDLEYLNSSPLKEASLRIEKVDQITDRFTLYRLQPILLTPEKKGG